MAGKLPVLILAAMALLAFVLSITIATDCGRKVVSSLIRSLQSSLMAKRVVVGASNEIYRAFMRSMPKQLS